MVKALWSVGAIQITRDTLGVPGGPTKCHVSFLCFFKVRFNCLGKKKVMFKSKIRL